MVENKVGNTAFLRSIADESVNMAVHSRKWSNKIALISFTESYRAFLNVVFIAFCTDPPVHTNVRVRYSFRGSLQG